MTRRSTFLPTAIASWSRDELQTLRSLAQGGASIEIIAQTLNRTVSSIRNKAGLHGISLAGSRSPSFGVTKQIANC